MFRIRKDDKSKSKELPAFDLVSSIDCLQIPSDDAEIDEVIEGGAVEERTKCLVGQDDEKAVMLSNATNVKGETDEVMDESMNSESSEHLSTDYDEADDVSAMFEQGETKESNDIEDESVMPVDLDVSDNDESIKLTEYATANCAGDSDKDYLNEEVTSLDLFSESDSLSGDDEADGVVDISLYYKMSAVIEHLGGLDAIMDSADRYRRLEAERDSLITQLTNSQDKISEQENKIFDLQADSKRKDDLLARANTKLQKTDGTLIKMSKELERERERISLLEDENNAYQNQIIEERQLSEKCKEGLRLLQGCIFDINKKLVLTTKDVQQIVKDIQLG